MQLADIKIALCMGSEHLYKTQVPLWAVPVQDEEDLREAQQARVKEGEGVPFSLCCFLLVNLLIDYFAVDYFAVGGGALEQEGQLQWSKSGTYAVKHYIWGSL